MYCTQCRLLLIIITKNTSPKKYQGYDFRVLVNWVPKCSLRKIKSTWIHILYFLCAEMRAVRLTGGQDRCSGKVEIHRNGSWGTLCDNCWNKDMSSMVCAMLQCGTEPEKFTQFVPPLAHNNGTLWYYSCQKNVQNMWQCIEYVNKTHLCISSKASGVICKGECLLMSNNISIR